MNFHCALFVSGDSMQKIVSASNPRIKFLKTLKAKKGRAQSKSFLLEGKRACLDALAHGVKFECVLVTQDFIDCDFDCEIIETTKEIIEALSSCDAPEGIIAQVKMQDNDFCAQKLSGDLVVFIDRLQDAGNLGTIIRTCDAAGVFSVVLSPETVELYNPKTVRATMSSIFSVNVMQAKDSIMALEEIKKSGYMLLSACLDGKDFYQNAFSGKKCLIIGNEGNGICDEIIALSDEKVTLPMRQGGAESLNASVAAGVLIYGLTFNR